jgi:hypothetical protein
LPWSILDLFEGWQHIVHPVVLTKVWSYRVHKDELQHHISRDDQWVWCALLAN